jgi:Tfp pilus assembly pilus retraction ATPase PilT
MAVATMTIAQPLLPELTDLHTMATLRELEFFAIYLGETRNFFAGIPQTMDPHPAPPAYTNALARLRQKCEDIHTATGRNEFTVRDDDISYRVSMLVSIAETIFVLRRFPPQVPDLHTLGIHPRHIEKLLTPGLTGLVVIAGAFGQGKTTTASSLMTARLSRFGGVGITVEDPPEMPLEGHHGHGICYQTWVEHGGFGEEIRKAARWSPSIIFLGEVRDGEAAAEALRASINGRLVICTTHSGSVTLAIERLYSLANAAAGNSEDVANLLANGLTAVLHQRLEADITGVKRPKLQFLWVGENDNSREFNAKGVRNTIRQRRFDQIENDVMLQLNQMIMKGRSA